MGCKHLLKSSFISDVDVIEVRPLAANKLNAIQRDLGGVGEIINNNYFVAVFEKSERGEGSNISSPTKEKPVSASFLIIAAPCGRIEIFQARRPIGQRQEHRAAAAYPVIKTVPTDMIVARLHLQEIRQWRWWGLRNLYTRRRRMTQSQQSGRGLRCGT
jgi:hypothetical protein